MLTRVEVGSEKIRKTMLTRFEVGSEKIEKKGLAAS